MHMWIKFFKEIANLTVHNTVLAFTNIPLYEFRFWVFPLSLSTFLKTYFLWYEASLYKTIRTPNLVFIYLFFLRKIIFVTILVHFKVNIVYTNGKESKDISKF